MAKSKAKKELLDLFQNADLKEEPKEAKEVEIADLSKESERLPTTEAECSSCGNEKAFYWLAQTRAGDEPETRFLKCTSCENTWREY